MSNAAECYRKLIGQFHGDELVYSFTETAGIRAATFAEHKLSLGGQFVIGTHVQYRQNMTSPYLNMLVFGLERSSEDSAVQDTVYTLHQFDSLGRASKEPFVGSWQSNELIFKQQNQSGVTLICYAFDDEGFRYLVQHTAPNGPTHKIVEGYYKRLC
jgi:hypothetical protein